MDRPRGTMVTTVRMSAVGSSVVPCIFGNINIGAAGTLRVDGHTVLGSEGRGRDEAGLLILVSINATGQASDPLHDLAVLGGG